MLRRSQRSIRRTLAYLALGSLQMTLSLPALGGVEDLAWMSGTWIGATGPGQELEENWSAPRAGSIAALVRARGEGATTMIELIVIEEQDDTLVLHLQQWDPGYSPRPGGPQRMTLTEMGERSVRFESGQETGIASLTYSRPADDTFTIKVQLGNGQTFDLVLKRA